MDSSCLWSVQQTRFCCLDWRKKSRSWSEGTKWMKLDNSSTSRILTSQKYLQLPLGDYVCITRWPCKILSRPSPLVLVFSKLDQFLKEQGRQRRQETKQKYGTVLCKLMALAKERGCCWSVLCKEWSIYTERLQLNQEPAGSNLPASFLHSAHTPFPRQQEQDEKRTNTLYMCVS
jgi:hypothetical protein